jgi:transposase
MQAVTTIGLDIAKSVFQVHGVDAEGKVVIRSKRRLPELSDHYSCIGINAVLIRGQLFRGFRLAPATRAARLSAWEVALYPGRFDRGAHSASRRRTCRAGVLG